MHLWLIILISSIILLLLLLYVIPYFVYYYTHIKASAWKEVFSNLLNNLKDGKNKEKV